MTILVSRQTTNMSSTLSSNQQSTTRPPKPQQKRPWSCLLLLATNHSPSCYFWDKVQYHQSPSCFSAVLINGRSLSHIAHHCSHIIRAGLLGIPHGLIVTSPPQLNTSNAIHPSWLLLLLHLRLLFDASAVSLLPCPILPLPVLLMPWCWYH